jgi:hypothetical protein
VAEAVVGIVPRRANEAPEAEGPDALPDGRDAAGFTRSLANAVTGGLRGLSRSVLVPRVVSV